MFKNIQGEPKVGLQYIANYCIPTFGPLCVFTKKNEFGNSVLATKCYYQ